MWARACQSEYTTTQVVSVGHNLADSSETKESVFHYSIIVFSLPFFLYVFTLFFYLRCQNTNFFHLKCGNCWILMCTVTEIVFQILLIIYQTKTIAALKAINPEYISFAVNNYCSDGPL